MKDSYRNTNAHLIFLKELSKQEAEITAILQSKLNDTEEYVEEFKNSIHKLKGSAEFFSYDNLGVEAKKLEKESNTSKISLESLFPLHEEIKNILGSISKGRK